MMTNQPHYDITSDNLSAFAGKGPAVVTFGRSLVRDTPSDIQRLERTGAVNISLAGSEYTLAAIWRGLEFHPPISPESRTIRTAGWSAIRRAAWASTPITSCRLRTPNRSGGFYMSSARRRARVPVDTSACTRLRAGSGQETWTGNRRSAIARSCTYPASALGCPTTASTTGITFLEAFEEAVSMKPAGFAVGLDFNYRGTLWSRDQCRSIMTPLMTEHVDILITTIEDMASIYGLG